MSEKNNNISGETRVIVIDELKEPRRAKVVLLNDNYTSMEFVVRILVEVFRKNHQQATEIMLSVHQKGRGECGVYPLEVAETKVKLVHAKARGEGYPLRCSLEYV